MLKHHIPPRLKEAAKHSFKNEKEIRRSTRAGCYCCCKMFPAPKVQKWVRELDRKRTAKCPHCQIDSVIGDASGLRLTPLFLREMCRHYFCYLYDPKTNTWHYDDRYAG